MALSPKDLVDSYQIEMPTKDVVYMDPAYLDSVVGGQGVTFIHYRAIPCPVGKSDPFDIRKTHADHSGCSNGHLYEYAGTLTGIFISNSKEFKSLDVGLVTGSTVQVTMPRFYDETGEEVFLAPFDRLFLKDVKAYVVTFQLIEHNTSGFDRTSFPISKVEHLMDSDGIRYYEGQDFVLADGQIKWTGKQPGMDPETGKGRVISIRYRYVPFWYVDRLLHEIRVVQTINGTERMPHAVLLQREYAFQNEENDPRSIRENSPRQQTAPRNGSFGPR